MSVAQLVEHWSPKPGVGGSNPPRRAKGDIAVDSRIHLTDRKTKILRLNFNPQEQMTQIELNEVLRLHKMWLNEEDGGQRANLCYADLRRADLSWANLRKADLSGADFRGVDLRGTNLRGADLRGADFRMADLSGAHLREADLKGADLRRADLSGADLREADLKDADLNNSNIAGEYFSDLNLYDCRKVPIHCRWSYGITNGMIHIGCVKKSIRDWDEFFASDRILETPRGTQEFKQIEAVYLACKAYLQHINR